MSPQKDSSESNCISMSSKKSIPSHHYHPLCDNNISNNIRDRMQQVWDTGDTPKLRAPSLTLTNVIFWYCWFVILPMMMPMLQQKQPKTIQQLLYSLLNSNSNWLAGWYCWLPQSGRHWRGHRSQYWWWLIAKMLSKVTAAKAEN